MFSFLPKCIATPRKRLDSRFRTQGVDSVAVAESPRFAFFERDGGNSVYPAVCVGALED